MKIAFIGFRGSGKSYIAKHLSKKIELPLISTDAMIEKEISTSIYDFVSQHGWKAFRDKEEKIAKELQHLDHIIIDCGGGIVENQNSINSILPNTYVIWIDAPLDTITQRIVDDNLLSRPPLSNTNPYEDIKENYLRRQPLYKAHAKLIIDNHLIPIEKIMQTITENLPHDFKKLD